MGDPKYFWNNFPVDTPVARMVKYAHRRAWVEQFHEEAKELLGWDQYQGRLWTGFHRNAALILLNYSFLVWLEWRERQAQVCRGRTRRAFPLGGISDGRRCRSSIGAWPIGFENWPSESCSCAPGAHAT